MQKTEIPQADNIEDPKPFWRKKIFIVMIAILALIGLGAGGFLYFKLHNYLWPRGPLAGPAAGESGNENDHIFRSLAVSPNNPNLVYVGSEGNGIFKSEDGGQNWTWLRNGLKSEEDAYPEVYDLLIDPEEENTVYAALSRGPEPANGRKRILEPIGGLYKSTDGGLSWRQYNTGLTSAAVTSVAKLGDQFFVGTDGQKAMEGDSADNEIIGGLFQSPDSGQHWTRLALPEQGQQNKYIQIVTCPDPSLIFAAGLKWQEVMAGQTYPADLQNSLGLVKSADQGQTWVKINPPGGFVQYFDVSQDGQKIMVNSDESQEIFASQDGGQSWQPFSVPASGPIKILSEDGQNAFFSNGKDLYITPDGLASYRLVFSPEIEATLEDIEIAPTDPNIIYLGYSGLRIFKSTDGGKNFEQVANLREFINQQKQE